MTVSSENVMNEGMEFYLEIAKRKYPMMEKHAKEIGGFQIDHNKWANVFFGKDILDTKPSRIASWWRQIFSIYHDMNRALIEGLGYLEIADTFSEESKKRGMIYNFQYETENYIFRLFALMEKIAQLSNIYHGFDKDVESVSFSKIMKSWDERAEDNFIRVVREHYLNSPNFPKVLRDIRNNMTHIFEIDLVGVGYSFLNPIKEEGKLGWSFGGYEYALDPEKMKNDLISSFQEITQMLKKIDRVLDAWCAGQRADASN